MNKLELIETLRNDAGLTKSEAKAVIKTFFSTITDALIKGDIVFKIMFLGFTYPLS